MNRSAFIESPCMKEACLEGHTEKKTETSDFKFPEETSDFKFPEETSYLKTEISDFRFPEKTSLRDLYKQKGFLGQFNRIGILLFTFFLFMGLFPSIFAPYAPEERFIPYEAPSEKHLLGTNDIGNDILSELVFGARISITIGFMAALISTLIGTGIGLCAGYFRGTLEELLMGFTDVVLVIPKIPLIIVLGAFLRPSIWILIFILGLMSWESTARVTRSKTLQLREAGYVKNAQCMGFSSFHILASDIFPNLLHILLPKFMMATSSALISEASLSFLGLSDLSMKNWGIMLSFAFFRGGFTRDMWWWYLPPGICITLCVLSIALIGFGLEAKEKENSEGGINIL